MHSSFNFSEGSFGTHVKVIIAVTNSPVSYSI